MGFLSQYDGVERIDLGEHEGTEYYVEVKKCLSHGESEAAERALVAVEMEEQKDGKSKAVMTPDMVTNTEEMVVASIVDWNLTDSADKLLGLHPEEILRASVKKLPQAVFDKIAKRVRELNADRTEEEDAQFPAGGERGAEGGEVEPSDDHQVLPGSEQLAEVGTAPGPTAAD
jgi:hypothetical protein